MTTALYALGEAATNLGPIPTLLALMPLLLLAAGLALAEPGGGSIRWIRIETQPPRAPRPAPSSCWPPPGAPPPAYRHLVGAPA